MPHATLPQDRRPVVISGPSGVGKGTLFKKLFDAHKDCFALSVSHTTRQPRAGEAHGVDYYYVTPEAFESLIAADGFVEHAKFGSNRYGTSKQTIADQTAKGRVVVLDIEMESGIVQGVKQIKNSGIEARYVFVKPPSFEELEKRLRGRGTETEESVVKRLEQAKVELKFADTPGVHDIIIVNDDVEKAYKELEDFIYKPVA
ncbi:guanylate kinase [Hypoxylon rubiginosum]|uniref:Guanylate kinase n=1 Tax=Hypoxylon rubiginosum TaxID=110542 RepID=A0ACC0CYR7_9PEZI|nr:guanylate kinase [Hypoxylon rubiginosum]